MVKLSIIVPVWNVYDYIDACLASLVKQTLTDIEIIVINDGSPDNSQEIIDKYTKKYPDKVKSYIKENGGQGSARNLGIKKAHGKYLSFVDSDDFIDKNFAKDMVSIAEKEKADIVICDMIDLYKDREVYHDCTNITNNLSIIHSVCNKIFKKELFDDIEFLSKVWYEDLNILLKLYPKINKISVIHKGYYLCNCRDTSTMNNNNSIKNKDIITAIEDAKEYLIKNKLFNENNYHYIVFNHVLIDTINRVKLHHNKDKNRVIKEITNYCHKNINNYKKYPFYKEVPMNRKIVAFLNYHSLSGISKLLLNIKQIIK